jgi:hypothetical protein
MRTQIFAVVTAALALLAGTAVAQQSPPPSAPTKAMKPAPAQAPAAAPSAAGPQVPGPDQLMILIRSILLAANHANLTGNYSVLRDLGTPDFQQNNNAARLADIFRDLRSKNIDIGPIAVLDGKLLGQPSIDPNGRLRLTGYFPSQPEQVNFALTFQMMGGRWRIYGMALNTTRNEPVGATGAAQPTPSPVPVGQTERSKNSASD